MFYTRNSKIKIFTDGGNLDEIIRLSKDKMIDGITTNPTLMRKSGVTNYMAFANAAIKASLGKSLSLEVFADDLGEMLNQARILKNLSDSVYVKIPITNSYGISTQDVIKTLIKEKTKVNITAVLSYEQIKSCIELFDEYSEAYISIFAGRIADTGLDPKPFFKYAFDQINVNGLKRVELLWASTREVFNIYEAAESNCHIITVPANILSKLKLQDYPLSELSLDTVKMFKNDSEIANYVIE